MVMRFFLNCCAAGARWWLHLATKSVILSQEIQLIEIFAIFFLQFFFSYRITCTRGATHAVFAARWRRGNFKKSRITIASKKITRVAAA